MVDLAAAEAALDGLCEYLTSVGVPTTSDLEEAGPPGGWVKPLTIERSPTLAGRGGVLTVALWLMQPAHGTEGARPALLAQLDQVLTALPDVVDESEPFDLDAALKLPDGGTYPATRLTLTLSF